MTIRICGDEAMRQPLKDLAAICAGQGAPQGDHNYCENGTPFIKAGNLQELLEGKAITSIQKVSDEVAKKHKLRLYPKGTILFAKSGMSCIKGYIYVLPQSAYVVSHLACITPNEDISEYLRYYFNYHKPNQLVKDAAYPSISLSDVGNLVVDMKPESERNEIVSVLQHTESIITLRQQQLQKLNELVKARFVELFGDCVLNSKGWKTKRLGDIAKVGSSKRVFVEDLKESGIPFYRGTEIGALAEGKTVTPELFISKEHYAELCIATGAPNIGDLLMPSICPDGRIWVVNTEKPFYFKDGRVLWVHAIDDSYNPVFLLYTLKDRIMSDYSSIASGTTFAELKIFALKECHVFDVPLELQNQFAAFVNQTDKSKVAIQKALDEAQLLFDSLMQKYFG